MLAELVIRDLALIQRAELVFGPGLNAITGETGAGKSLLVGALGFLLGEAPRGGAGSLVREGASEARVDGRFVWDPSEELGARVLDWLRAWQPEIAREWDDGAERELVLSRAAGVDGRTRGHVNGRPVTRRVLRELADLLVEVHGQHEQLELFEPVQQLFLLDAYGELDTEREAYAAERGRWIALFERLQRLEREKGERRRTLEYLAFQIEELRALDLAPGERDLLSDEREMLRHSGDMRAQLGALVEELAEGEGSVLERLHFAARVVRGWRERLHALDAPHEDLTGALVHVEEAGSALSSLLDRVESDPNRLEEVEERLAEIERLEHKHGARGDELLTKLDALERDAEELDEGERALGSLGAEHAAARDRTASAALELARKRAALGPELAREVVAALKALGLSRARFEVRVKPRAAGLLSVDSSAERGGGRAQLESGDLESEEGAERGSEAERGAADNDNDNSDGDGDGDGASSGEPRPALADDLRRFGPNGCEDLEFLLSANPGEPLRPLRHVASGGEAARILLALRGVLARCEPGRALVFDEIDSGVGGRLGPAVGRALRELAAHHQVLCVTHLPAIAALAHAHLRVQKRVERGRTHVGVELLDGEPRVLEIADMIAGGAEQETARAEARRLLEGV